MADHSSTSSAPTPGQCELLSFFGKAIPQTKRQASFTITDLLLYPINARRWLVERARRYVGSMELRTETSTMATYNVTRVLLHGFGLAVEEARPILEEWNSRCAVPREPRELEHKLSSTNAQVSQFPRGYLVGDMPSHPSAATKKANGVFPKAEVAKKVTFEVEKLQAIAKPLRGVVNLMWLGNRSSEDPATVGHVDFLKLLYAAGEKVLVFTDYFSQGQAVWPAEPVPDHGPLGVWFLPAPVDGLYHPNPRSIDKDGNARQSRRSEESVTCYRYILLESDKADVWDWLAFIVQVPLPIEALYTSGGRSIHALVRVDCRTKPEWEAEKKALMPFLMGCVMCGGDRGVLSGVRLSRLPGCWREGKDVDYVDDRGRKCSRYERFLQPKRQKLLFVRPGADDRPICDLPPLRDVERTWCQRGAKFLDGYEDPQFKIGEIKSALGYYAPVSETCRGTLKDLEGEK